MVLLFAMASHVNMLNNIQHMDPHAVHEHTVLSIVEPIEDHDHHATDGDDHDEDPDHLPSMGQIDHGHPNTIGSALPNDGDVVGASLFASAKMHLSVAMPDGVIGHIQQTPDRPPKAFL
jgi:hypothetical protein